MNKCCHFCGKEQEEDPNELKELWVGNTDDIKSWRYLPLDKIAHMDCYIENIVLEKIESLKVECGVFYD